MRPTDFAYRRSTFRDPGGCHGRHATVQACMKHIFYPRRVETLFVDRWSCLQYPDRHVPILLVLLLATVTGLFPILLLLRPKASEVVGDFHDCIAQSNGEV